jgi:hypothetical protein
MDQKKAEAHKRNGLQKRQKPEKITKKAEKRKKKPKLMGPAHGVKKLKPI